MATWVKQADRGCSFKIDEYAFRGSRGSHAFLVGTCCSTLRKQGGGGCVSGGGGWGLVVRPRPCHRLHALNLPQTPWLTCDAPPLQLDSVSTEAPAHAPEHTPEHAHREAFVSAGIDEATPPSWFSTHHTRPGPETLLSQGRPSRLLSSRTVPSRPRTLSPAPAAPTAHPHTPRTQKQNTMKLTEGGILWPAVA